MPWQLKDLARSLLQLRFSPWPRNFGMPRVWQASKQASKKERKKDPTAPHHSLHTSLPQGLCTCCSRFPHMPSFLFTFVSFRVGPEVTS